MTRLARNVTLEFVRNEGGELRIFLDGKDVSDEIRSVEISANVKYVARVKGVRNSLASLQRRLGKQSRGAVLEGRDITTVVFPDAQFKYYLDASLEERIKRRFEELKKKGIAVTREQIEDDVRTRDFTDMTRKSGPLKKAPGAQIVDTTSMTIEDVVEKILKDVAGSK